MVALRGRRLSTILNALGWVLWALLGLAAYLGRIPWAVATLLIMPMFWGLSRLARLADPPKETRQPEDVGLQGQ